jgi:Transcriptional activator of acetoin/glycerol metabolism
MTNAELRAKWEQLHSDVGERKGLPLEIRDSWERSRAFAVNRHFRENPYIATRAELNEARNRAEFMIEKSASVMNGLYEFVAGTGFVVLLGDVNLCLLKVVGDRESLAFAQRARLVEGSMWSERLVGTNAGALAYDLAKPVSVFGYQHFCLFSHVAACSCAPILDEDRIVGVLGLSAPYNRVSNHTLGMVVASTKHIKAKMAMERARRYHEVLTDSIQEGLFAIDINGNITFANKNCAETLRMGRETLFGRNIYELLGHSPDNLYFINRITSGRSSDENYSLTIGRKTVRFNATCCPLNDPDSTEKGSGNRSPGKPAHQTAGKRFYRWGGQDHLSGYRGPGPGFSAVHQNRQRSGFIPFQRIAARRKRDRQGYHSPGHAQCQSPQEQRLSSHKLCGSSPGAYRQRAVWL